MIHHNIEICNHKKEGSDSFQVLSMHADNFSGQNKNRYVLFYLYCRFLSVSNEQITLRFLASGHTQNRFDGAFGLAKRRLRQKKMNSRQKICLK